MNISDDVLRIIGELLSLDQSDLSLVDTFEDDLDCELLQLVEIAMAFESEFNVEISDEEISEMKTIDDCVNTIRAKLN